MEQEKVSLTARAGSPMNSQSHTPWRSPFLGYFAGFSVLVVAVAVILLGCGGFGAGALALLAVGALVGVTHYLWWGLSLDREVDAERRAMREVDERQGFEGPDGPI
jgi:hypothetical protein